MGAILEKVELDTLEEGVDYSVDPGTEVINELVEIGDGVEVLASYTTDFVLPTIYGRPFNASPDLDDSTGKWTGKSLVDGTYTVFCWGARELEITEFAETTEYRAPTKSSSLDFLVGSATTLQPYDLISSEENCLSCHSDLYFHGANRRGFASCIGCHGVVGSEDRPQYVAPNAPATTGVSVTFRDMLHTIHMGADLANADSYTVVGFGPVFPNNFRPHQYDHVVFPSQPRKAQDCVACHGDGNEAYLFPIDRDHPTEQVKPVREWDTCISCHDSSDAVAHVDSQTAPSGAQACGVCHDLDELEGVGVAHKLRDN